jgi:hypothetical protein
MTTTTSASSGSTTASAATTSTGGTSTITAATSTGGETNIRVIIFSGKKDDWETWKEKFAVKAAIRGYENILSGEDVASATHDKQGNKLTLTADEINLSEQNKNGFGDLILSIDCTSAAGKVAFSMVKSTKTKNFPVVTYVMHTYV